MIDDPALQTDTTSDLDSYRVRKTWDVWLSILLLLGFMVLAMSSSYTGMIAGTTATCANACASGTALTVGLALMTFAPIVLFFAAAFLVIRRMSRRLLAFWVPLAAFVVLAPVWYLGVALAAGGA